jgi:hypothetical protein
MESGERLVALRDMVQPFTEKMTEETPLDDGFACLNGPDAGTVCALTEPGVYALLSGSLC